MDNLARTLADNPELGNGVEELDLSMLKPDVEDEIALAVARKGARTTARTILRRVKPTTLSLTLADEDSQNILTAVKEGRLKHLTLPASSDNASRPRHLEHNLMCWRRFIRRVTESIEILKIVGLAQRYNAESVNNDIVESEDECTDAMSQYRVPMATAGSPLKSLALPACGGLEQNVLVLETLHVYGSPLLFKCDAAKLDMQYFAIYAEPGLTALTYLRIASWALGAHWTTLMQINTSCPDIAELHIVCTRYTPDAEVVPILSSLADSVIFAHLAVLTFTRVEAFTADANNAAVTWRHGPRDKVELRLQHVSQAEWDRL